MLCIAQYQILPICIEFARNSVHSATSAIRENDSGWFSYTVNALKYVASIFIPSAFNFNNYAYRWDFSFIHSCTGSWETPDGGVPP